MPPGPPVLSPLVAEIYGPDEAGRHAVAKRVRAQFGRTRGDRGHRRHDGCQRAEGTHARSTRRAQLARRRAEGHRRDDARRRSTAKTSRCCTTAQAKYEIPVRLTLPPERQAKLDETAGDDGARAATARWCRCRSWCRSRTSEREKTIYHKDLLPVSYVIGDMAGKIDSPLYGMFAVRARSPAPRLPEGGTSRRILHPPAGGPLSRSTRSNGTANGR